jgi:hypothetical protein
MSGALSRTAHACTHFVLQSEYDNKLLTRGGRSSYDLFV